ncbi:thioredoxin family protein [uncultured Lutibacter sp.]|uniref:thioredoxin family protein n=1 Tax=uncultured Lutibacter sp. TaxID=437739 RepID=UPI002602DE42|nr:thioredoxin family protein [uncultured Lutibacter sp.]
MKKIFLSYALVLITFSGFSQNWLTNLEEAKEISANENKNIVLVFQGSDWCAPCIKLDREIWSTQEFKKYADKNFVMLRADFPRKKKNKLTETQIKSNKELMEKYNLNGYFPFVVVLDKNGKVLGNTGYKKTTPKEYINTLSSF